MEDRLDRDRADVLQLPDVRAGVADAQQRLGEAALTVRNGWGTVILDEEPPGRSSEAAHRLSDRQRQVESELTAFQEEDIPGERDRVERDRQSVLLQIHTSEHSLGQASLEAGERARELGLPLRLPLERNQLWADYPELAGVRAGDEDAEEAAWNTAREARSKTWSDRDALAEIRHVEPAPLDLAAEETSLGDAQRDIRVKETIVGIVRRTRDSLVSRVMPLTIQNMQQLLPLLTDGRYHEAQWDETTNSISVYDVTAGSYQRKRVFSGGARDQISLALRLAFALATLPGEHQRRPGFLFLDEPLSSFDRPRTQALVDLLTRGLLREQFQQLFLISHSESFDPGMFDHRIQMDAGRIVESTLPAV